MLVRAIELNREPGQAGNNSKVEVYGSAMRSCRISTCGERAWRAMLMHWHRQWRAPEGKKEACSFTAPAPMHILGCTHTCLLAPSSASTPALCLSSHLHLPLYLFLHHTCPSACVNTCTRREGHFLGFSQTLIIVVVIYLTDPQQQLSHLQKTREPSLFSTAL